jgi:hypothetical protein
VGLIPIVVIPSYTLKFNDHCEMVDPSRVDVHLVQILDSRLVCKGSGPVVQVKVAWCHLLV